MATSLRSVRRVGSLLGALSLASVCGCLEEGYPLPTSGRVSIGRAVAGALFASDSLDAAGRPLGPRQQPYATLVDLYISEGGEAAHGAFVFVHVEPAEALALTPAKDPVSGEETCELLDGSFRCMATEQGFARFLASSESDWSGSASIVVTWADTGEARDTVEVKPAGLPDTAANFDMIVSAPADKVLATYDALACTTGPISQQPSEKWRPGKIRNVEAYVRATPPTTEPTVVENAPVYIESLEGEGALSLDADCSERVTRLRVLLGPTGESAPFRLCFSDIGGAIPFGFFSGEHNGSLAPEPRVLTAEPEPRLLRVTTLVDSIFVGETAAIWQVDAYDANLDVVAMSLDLEVDKSVLRLDAATAQTSSEPSNPTLVLGEGRASGTTQLRVRPRLLATPECVSEDVTVE
jgi:hypothetical protein